MAASTPSPAWIAWQRASSGTVRAFHTYANWLVSISWKRFFLLALLLMIVASILEHLPPFSWRVTETVEMPDWPKPPLPPHKPRARIAGRAASLPEGLDISIDEKGVRIVPRGRAAPASAGAASGAVPAPVDPAASAVEALPGNPAIDKGVRITLPPGASSEQVREAIQEAKEAVAEALEEARQAAHDAEEQAREAAAEAAAEARQAEKEAQAEARGTRRSRTRTVRFGDFLTDLAFLWIIGSAIIKITYKGKLQAEVKAAVATEAAEAESLKRQVVEARMAAMQAQVEPHFLFNTLASIDHLIETDPPRASRMQKNLIALLRASMPTLREANDGGLRDLGRELAVIRPYLEILKVRMEERLQTVIDVPEGLDSAQFPPMMIQTLVENAIKHGLEPKPEGGTLTVKAEIVHGKLAVRVADTGLGFGKAATAGTGVGLANIRERLQLLYGHKATLTVAENQPSGTVVTITVPYAARPMEGEMA